MPTLNLKFGAAGPIVDMGVLVSTPRRQALIASQRNVPDPVAARGLIDTGASVTCIDPSIIAQLELSPTTRATVHTPSSGQGGHECNMYDVSLAIFMDSGQLHLASLTIPVAEAELSHQGVDALIGRDVLSKALLVYNGVAGEFSISF